MSVAAFAVLIGLWDFAAVAPGESPEVPAARTVEVHASASSSSKVVATLEPGGIRLASSRAYSCRWRRDLDLSQPPAGCVFTESDYEVRALAVFGRRSGWVQIALTDDASSLGWVVAGDRFHPLDRLIASDERLTYLTREWDGALYQSARWNAPAKRVQRTRDEVPYRAVRTAIVDGTLWLEIEILDSVCEAAEPRPIDRGWVPAQSGSGRQWTWFWSRGC